MTMCQYIADIANAVTAQRPDAPGLPDAEAQEVFRDSACG